MTSLLLLFACADAEFSRSAPEAENEGTFGRKEDKSEMAEEAPMGGAAPASAAPAQPAPKLGGSMDDYKDQLGYDDGERKKGRADAPDGAPPPEVSAEAAATPRAWFPESFLWRPMIEVPASGAVTVPVTVPDTLTTWRLLALGQTRDGAQAGGVGTFSSTLPAYVDVVAPTFLYAGDTVLLPVQAISQEAEPLSAPLEVLVDGATVGGGTVSLAAYGSRTETVSVSAARAGDLHLLARFGTLDSVARVVPVRPVGRLVETVRGGTLAGPRSFAMAATPGGSSGTLVVTAFPGALGVARAELDAAPSRGDDVASAAYTYAVAGLAAPLVDEGAVAADVLRATQLRAWQALAKATRAPDAATAVLVLAALRTTAPADTLAGRLAIRLADAVRQAQAPDGLWTADSGAALDVALVQTAQAVWALGADNRANRLRATGAFERHRARLAEPYVAAWALAADVVDPSAAEAVRATLREALHTTPDGAKTLRVTATRPDGARVSEAEATALALLALPADDPARADLAAGLLGLYDPRAGFGDGQTGLYALRALEAVFAGDIPREVVIKVQVDGVDLARGVLDPSQPHAPVRILGPGLTGVADHRITVVSEPAVPGLAFTAVARDYVPWEQAAPAGLDLTVSRGDLVVGERTGLDVSVSAPTGVALDLSVGLPAGVEPDAATLDALVSAGRMAAWKAEDGRVTLTGLRTEAGAWSATIVVTPTLAGSLLADATRVYPSGQPGAAFARVPERWGVR
jgi:hypothetical protein